MIESPLIDARQAAKYLAISLPTFYRYLQQNIIPPGIKLGTRATRWHIDDLNNYIQERRASAHQHAQTDTNEETKTAKDLLNGNDTPVKHQQSETTT